MGPPLLADSRAKARISAPRSVCRAAVRRQMARFSGERTRHGATENCIIGMSA
jgi:hypothetical protein